MSSIMNDLTGLMLCKQKVNDIKVIFSDGATRTISAMKVASFSIEKNFFSDFLPIFHMTCMVDYDLYKKINEEKCVFNMDINKFYVASANTTYDKKKIMTKNFINGIFTNKNTGDSSPNMYENISNRTQNTNIDQPNEFQKSQIELELYMFQEEALSYTTLNDNIYASCDVFSAILGLATVTKQRNMLISYPDNIEVYSNIVIPNNLTFIGGIEFLHAVYGIYNKSYCLFSDFDCNYLIDKDTKCTAYRNNENTRVFISYTDKTTNSGNINGQVEDNAFKCYRINSTSSPSIVNISDTSNSLLASNINTINTKNSSTNISSTSDASILDNKYDNSFAIDSFKYEKSLTTTITAEFKEVDLDIFKLNREYYFVFDMQTNSGYNTYKDAEGLYKIMTIQAVYQKKDDEIFENIMRIIFIRA